MQADIFKVYQGEFARAVHCIVDGTHRRDQGPRENMFLDPVYSLTQAVVPAVRAGDRLEGKDTVRLE